MKHTSIRIKKLLWTGVVSCISLTSICGQFPIGIDIVYDFIKTNSIHRYQINWATEDHQFWSAISSAHSLNDTMDAFVHVFKDLDDVYSQLHYNNQNYGYVKAGDENGSPRIHQLKEIAELTTGKIKCELVDEQYAYIRIPGNDAYGSLETSPFSWTLRDTIDYWNRKNVKGFILDLRLNMGGNIYPMLNGLGHLLGEGVIVNEVDISYLRGGNWKIQNGNFMTKDFAMANTEETQVNPLSEIPIVILTGPVTASSGSITAIAFKGRKNTISIGEPTATGYTTSNEYFQFAPNLFLNLGVAYVADRNMRFYPSAVEPDIVVREGDDFENLMKDQKIKRALLWLKENTK